MGVNVTQFILYGCYLTDEETTLLSDEVRSDLCISVRKNEDKEVSYFPDCYSGEKNIIAKVIYQGPYDEQSGAEDGIWVEIAELDKAIVQKSIESYIGESSSRKYGFIFINYYT